jgi:hypothetical protein
MKHIPFILTVVLISATLLGCGSNEKSNNNHGHPNNYLLMKPNIVFGAKNSSPCSGKGICKIGPANEPVDISAIPVTIEVDSFERDTLIISFSLADLEKQPLQHAHFAVNSPIYAFDAIYLLTAPIFRNLQLKQPNPRILPTSPHNIEKIPQGNDILVIYRIVYSHG